MRASSRLLFVVASAVVTLSGCDGCGRRESRAGAARVENVSGPAEIAPGRACATAADCSDRDPCTTHECIDERCVASLVPRGTSCDNDTVCDGLAACDANGRCVAGSPPVLDDGNACTVDACDAKRGVVHEPVSIDDFDACTSDACDPATGSIAHTSLVVDDQNDCTVDSCDPRAGVKHEARNGKYTCQASCEPGLHVASRSRAPECGSPEALRSFCAPNCGPSFHSCDAACPSGYEKRSATPGGTCGTNPSIMTFCVKQG